MAVGREVAEAYIDVHGDLSPFRADLESIRDSLTSIDDRLQKAFKGSASNADGFNNKLRTTLQLTESFTKKLQGLAGLNVLEDSFRYGIQFMQNIDRNSVQLAKMVTMVGTVAAEVVHLAGAAAVLSQDIVALGGIGILAPGFLTGFGIAMGVTVAAMKDMSKVLADLAPSFSRLQDAISEEFWAQAAQPIRDLVNTLMPTLNEQLRATARAMGGLFAEFAVALKTEATPERVTIMMERLNRAIDIARAAIRPFTAAVVTLGEVGSQYFGRFAEAIVNVSERFNNFIQNAAANGDLNRWVENAIEGFKNLFRLLEGAAGIIGAIGDAARAAGVGGLKVMADNLQAASDIMNSPRFQTAMTTLFQGVKAATDGIVAGIARLGPAFEAAMPTIENVFGFIGQAAERVGGILAGIISNPQFLAGLQDFAASIVAALDKLAPAVEPFATSLGGLLDLMGNVLVAVAEIGSKIIQVWGPIFDQIGQELGKLVGPMGETLGKVIDALAPAWQSLADNVLPTVAAIIKDNILPFIEKIATELGPTLKIVFEELGKLLADLKPGLDFLTGSMESESPTKFSDQLKGAQSAWDDFYNAVNKPLGGQGLIPWLESDPVQEWGDTVGQSLEDFWVGLGERFRLGAEQIGQFFSGMWTGFTDIMNNAETAIETGWNDFWNGLGQTAQTLWNGFLTWIGEAWTNISNAFMTFMAPITEAWNNFWTGLSTFVQTAWAGFMEFLGTIWTNITTGIQNFITGVQMVWDAFWNGLIALPGVVWGLIQTGFQTFVNFFVTLWTSFWNGLSPQAQAILTNIVNFITTVWNNIVAGVQGFVGTVVNAWNSFWNTVFTAAQTILTNVWNFITTTVNNIATSINSFISGVINAWNKFWGDVWNSVQKAWNDIFGGVNKGTSDVSNSVQKFISDVVSNWNNFWNGVFQTVQNIWNQIVSSVTNFINGLRNNIQNFLSSVAQVWNSNWQNISNIVSNVWNTIVNFVNNGINNVRNFVSSGMSAVQSFISNAWNTAVSFVSSAWSNIVNAVSSGVNNVMSFVGSLPGRIASALGSLASTLFNIGVNMIQGLISGIQAMIGNVIGAVSNVVNGAIGAAKSLLGIASPSKVFTKFGQQTGEGFVVGTESMRSNVAKAIGSLADAAMSAIDTNMMKSAGADAAAGLAAGLKGNRDIIERALSGFGIDLGASAQRIPVKAVASETQSASDPVPQVVNNYEAGAIVQNTKVEDPTIAAKKLLDALAGQ